MAHFAEISEDNTVLRVLVVPDEQEHRGHDFLSRDLRLGGRWIQCSYNERIRKCYPGKGFTYLEEQDIFIPPQPYPSWSLDKNFDWQPPTPKPYEEPENGLKYYWDEDTTSWKKFP